MVLTAAERSKRYREKIKQDPVKHEMFKKKELKRLKKHAKKTIDLTEEEKEARRKRWREQKRKQKQQKNAKQTTQQSTPLASTSIEPNPVTKAFKNKYKNLNNKYNTLLKKVETYVTAISNMRKKLYREKTRHEKETLMLINENEKLKARQEVMEIALSRGYINCKRNKEKRIIKEVALNIGHTAKNKLLGLRGRVRKPNLREKNLNKKIVDDFEIFFCRDDISRATAGKRETRTKNKNKVQIRYLLDTLKNIFQIYKDEGGKYSFTTFVRYKPFYILSPSARTRNTCLCIKHSNVEFMFESLKLKGVIPYTSTTELLENIACNVKSFECMYNKCNECKTRSIIYNNENLQDEVSWFKWGRVIHKYKKAGEEISTKKVTKQKTKDTVKELINEFENQLIPFKTHVFNWKEQQRQYRDCVSNMHIDEIGILCDFSENYECKYSEEVQSTHFGASKTAITLHCGVILGKDRLQSFVTVSDQNCHEPHAIWAHLLPIIKLAKEQFPHFKIIHFFSDGPSTQYRQKKNFYLLNYFTENMKLDYSTWSFSEAGHGKSMADGIGGSVKRQLDKRVSYGHDITNATEACHVLHSTMKSVKSFYISDNDIQIIKNFIPDHLRAVPGTMQLHQIISTQLHEIQYRVLSCFCGEKRGLCSCYFPKLHRLTDPQYNMVPKLSETSLGEIDLIIGEERLPQSLVLCPKPGALIESSAMPSTSRGCVASESSTNWLLPSSQMYINNSTENIIDTFDDQILDNDSFFNIEPLKINLSTFEDHGIISISPNNFEIKDNLPMQKVFPDINTDKKENVVPQSINRTRLKELKDVPSQVMPSLLEQKVKMTLSKKKTYSSSSRTFPCHICKTRHLFVLGEMAKCMVCHKWVCFSCSGTNSFDYICPVCLSD